MFFIDSVQSLAQVESLWSSESNCSSMSRVLSDIKRVSLLSSYIGLSPLRFDNDQLSVSKISVVFIIVYSFLLTSLAFFTDMLFSRKDYEGQLSSLLLTPLQALSCILIFLGSLYALCQVKKLNSFLRDIELVDEHLSKLKATIPYPCNHSVLLLSLTCVTTSTIMLQIALKTWQAHLYSFCQHMIWVMPVIPVYQLRGFLLIVSSRLEVILRILKEARSHKTLCVLTKCHSLMARSAEQLNNAVSLMFFAIILFVFILLMGELYSLYFLTFLSKYSKIFVRSIWVSYGLTILIPVVFTCDLISEQAQEFHQVQYRLIIHDKSGLPWDNTSMPLYTCLRKDIKFSAFGAFCIDNKLLKSIAVAILTHLIILIQVSQEIPDYPKKAYHIGV